MSLPTITDPRAKRWAWSARWLLLFPLGFVIAPYVMTALFGLFGALIGILGMVATWMLRPWVTSVAANMRLKLIRHEAAKNPVDTLLETYRKRCISLDERKGAIERLNAQIMTFADKVDDIAARYGDKDRDYVKLSTDLVNLRRVYEHRCLKWREARKLLDRFKEECDRGNMIWEAGCAAAAAKESSGYTEDDFLQALKTDTAFDAIDTNYNAALASLDTALLDEPAPTPVYQPTDPAFKELIKAPAHGARSV